MARPNRIVSVALLLVATTSVANCQIFGSNITQFQILGRGLTCSNPSPSFFSFLFPSPILSGATVSMTCNGGSVLNTTTTNDSGDFSLFANNPATTNSFFPLFNCQVLVTLPANCKITSFFQPVTALKSFVFFPNRVDTNLTSGGQTLTATSGLFFPNYF